MMARNTDGNFEELIRTKGLEAAKRRLDERKQELDQERDRLEYQLSQINNQLLALDGEFRRAVRGALDELGIEVTAGSGAGGTAQARPAVRGGRRTNEQIEHDRQAILAALPDSADKALSISEVAQAVGRDTDEMRNDFLKLRDEDMIVDVGSGRNKRYYRAA